MKYLFTALIFGLSLTISLGQKEKKAEKKNKETAEQGWETPREVKKDFIDRHPGATAAKWEEENGFYKVEFKDYGFNWTSHYTSDGKVEKTTVELDEQEVPLPIFNSLREEYAGWAIKDVDIGPRNDTMAYRVLIENETGKEMKITFNQNGKTMEKKESKGL